MHQLWSIQYLRALAALGVIAFHLLQATRHPLIIGAMGVDVFFVISGFIMFSITAMRATAPLQFMADRIARIAPTYWIATGLAFLCAVVDLRILHYSDASLSLLVKSLLFIPSFDTDGYPWPTMLVGWTLNYEMFFYVVFALSLLPVIGQRRLIAVTGAFAILIALGRVLALPGLPWQTYTSPRLLEFLAGAWIGYLFIWQGPKASAAILMLALVAVMFMCSAFLPDVGHGGLACLIVVGAVIMEGIWMPKIAALKLLGDASYSIYLFQQFALDGIGHLLHLAARLLHAPFDVNAVMLPLEFAGAVGLGLAAHFLLEKPSTKIVRAALSGLIHRPVQLV